MYRREQERTKRSAAIALGLRASAERSWSLCAEASRALLMLGNDAEFRRLLHGHHGLLVALPASLAAAMSSERADAVLNLAVARATLRPVLVRVEVLGWLAHAYPLALVALLEVVAGDDRLSSDGASEASDPSSRRRRHAAEVNGSSEVVGVDTPTVFHERPPGKAATRTRGPNRCANGVKRSRHQPDS